MFTGFPLIDWDSERYIRAAIWGDPSPHALTLLCYLLKPLVTVLGPWGFAIFQISILTYTMVSILKFYNKNAMVGIVSIAVSIAGYFAISVMMDIYTVTGLLALFLVLNGNKDIFLYLVISACYIAHPENLLLFPVCALIYWVAIDRSKVFLMTLAFLFVIPIFSIVLMNYWQEKEIRFIPKAKYIMLMTHIATDSPQITRAYMNEFPASEFSKQKEFFEYTLTTSNPYHWLLWDNWDKMKGLAYNKNIQPEAKDFVYYAFKNHQFILLKSFLRSTLLFLI